MMEQAELFTRSQGERRAGVLSLLKDRHWHTTVEINSIGGTEGTRRLRELRAQGHDIEKRKADGSSQYEYRLRCSP